MRVLAREVQRQLVWWFYADLKAYRRDPDPRRRAALRARFEAKVKIVVPGIRPSGSPRSDQKRTLTPAEAIARGADILVIGRPISGADDPRAAALAIAAEIDADRDRVKAQRDRLAAKKRSTTWKKT